MWVDSIHNQPLVMSMMARGYTFKNLHNWGVCPIAGRRWTWSLTTCSTWPRALIVPYFSIPRQMTVRLMRTRPVNKADSGLIQLWQCAPETAEMNYVTKETNEKFSLVSVEVDRNLRNVISFQSWIRLPSGRFKSYADNTTLSFVLKYTLLQAIITHAVL